MATTGKKTPSTAARPASAKPAAQEKTKPTSRQAAPLRPAADKPAATKAQAAKSAAKPVAAKPAAKPVAKPVVAKPSPARPPAPRPVAGNRSAAAKPMDPALQASKQALADALAAAKAVKIEKPLTPPGKKAKAEKEAKPEKVKKNKLVRDSFTMPEKEYEGISALKKRLLAKGVVAKKSEVLRAGVALLASLTDDQLTAALGRIEVIKTGRPAKSGK